MRDLMGLEGEEGDRRVGGNMSGLSPVRTLKVAFWSGREVCGRRGVAVKCRDITQNSDCEGSIPAPY